jgi:hypothetical protein
VWLLHEQVGIALMECGALQQALPLIKAVLIKFPGSIRARRLQVTAVLAHRTKQQQQQLQKERMQSNVHCDTSRQKAAASIGRSTAIVCHCVCATPGAATEFGITLAPGCTQTK